MKRRKIEMYDSHVTMAAVSTRVELGRQRIMVTREAAGQIFRAAAAQWAEEREVNEGYEAWLDEQADRREYELSLEM